jgi:hypothetical protein
MAATVCELPNTKMEGLWDSLIFEANVKVKLLNYIHATLVLSDADIDCTSLHCHPSSKLLIIPQLTWYHGTASFCCMAPPERAKHLSAAP